MAHATLHASNENPYRFRQEARRCALWVVGGFASLASLGGIAYLLCMAIGAIADVLPAIAKGLIWAVSLGGNFWAAFAIACTALFGFAWASLMRLTLPKQGEEDVDVMLFWCWFVAFSFLLLATCAMMTLLEPPDDLNIREVATVVMVGFSSMAVVGVFSFPELKTECRTDAD